MEVCKLCSSEFKSIRSLCAHIRSHSISSREYYDIFFGVGKCETCGKVTEWRNMNVGYLKFCSIQCSSIAKIGISVNAGRKQSKETIRSRIQNTDQVRKEASRKKTMLKRYGVNNPSKIPEVAKKISIANLGKKSPRTKEHQRKIIESKRANGTLKHSEETKRLMSKIGKERAKNESLEERQKYVSANNNSCYTSGTYNGIYYRSSYELKFLEWCFENSVKVVSAETSQYSVSYVDSNGINRAYFPDFYLPDYDAVVEIKPLSMLDYGENLNKFDAAATMLPNFTLLTELELDNLTNTFKYELVFPGQKSSHKRDVSS